MNNKTANFIYNGRCHSRQELSPSKMWKAKRLDSTDSWTRNSTRQLHLIQRATEWSPKTIKVSSTR